jgi:4-hydroxy-tetrahydrodipicolinate synthase
MPPYYFNYEPPTIEAYCLEFASQVAKWVAVYLYNIPQHTGAMDAAMISRLAASGLFAGIKDSSGDWELMQELIAVGGGRPWRVLAGNDRIFRRARATGAAGAVSGVACAVPELMVGLDRAIAAGAIHDADLLDRRVQEFIDQILPFPSPVGIKTAVALRGIKSGPLATPLGEPLDAKLEQFRGWFREWLPVVQRECSETAAARG